MSRRIRPSARRKTLGNVMHSNLSTTDKRCIEEVFWEFGKRTKVVRCKDCKMATEDILLEGLYHCGKDLMSHRADHFCGYGVRKEEDPNEKK